MDSKNRCVECEIQGLLFLTSVSEAVTLCLVIALQKLVKPVVRRLLRGLFVIIGQIRNGFGWCKTYWKLKVVEDTHWVNYNEFYHIWVGDANESGSTEYYIASWTKDKVNYNRVSKFNTNKHRQVLHGQIWFCDLGYNIGTEKNKMRPVLVMSNNKINNSEKVVVVCITDAKGKVNARCLPIQDSWFLLYSDTEDEEKASDSGKNDTSVYAYLWILDKDSMIQCEEIRAVSKARLDANRGCIGTLTPEDFNLVKGKFKRAYNL